MYHLTMQSVITHIMFSNGKVLNEILVVVFLN